MARDQEVRHGPQRRQGPDQGRPVGAAEERVGPERRPTRPARVRREHQRDPLDRVQARGTPRDDPQAGARTHPCAASRNSQNSERRSHGATSTSDNEVVTFSWTSRPGGEPFMAKCGRKQHDRAVCLYITYGRCAADAIRELGYPSRGALWMWYKDRLK